jgi:uncharacterized protein involved in exopolysaccharide biosynthesis
MQPLEPSTTARRPLDFEDYVDILRRHKGWILGPGLAALVLSVAGAFLWPDTFVSVATIRVVPPQVPENFVPANVNVDVQGRVNSLIQLILNRATLTNIINTHNLYKRDRERLPLDDVIENMKLYDIKCCPVLQNASPQSSEKNQYPAFQIGFAYDNRFTAQKVTADLVARFLEENVREVSQQTVATTQFLRDQWEAAKKKLDGVEQQLSVFRGRNIGRLPEEQQSNYQQLNAMQSQMLNLNTAMNRVNQERLLYENQLRINREQLSSLKDPGSPEQTSQPNEKLAEKDREIEQYENSLSAARERYKETHPDVQRLLNLLAAAKNQRESILKQQAVKTPDAPEAHPLNPQVVKEQRELQVAIQRVQGLIQAKDLEMEDHKRQAVEVEKALRNYQARIESVPVGIKEYDELLRDRDLAKKDYEDLDRRLNASAMSTALENRQQGARLEQLDPPSVPQTPTQPKRWLIISAAAALGLVAGIGLAAAKEFKDTALKNLKDVRAYAQLPVLGNIPLLETGAVILRRKRLAWLAWSTACFVGAIVMSSSVVYYFATRV